MSSVTRRHVDPVGGRPSTHTPRASGTKTPRSSTGRVGSKGKSEDGEELIVTRGLQELLDAEMQTKRTVPTGRSAKARRSIGQAPNFVFCYLCGRQFGKASIEIHRPQCYLKKMIQWERGDPATRGPKPVDIETHEQRVQAQLQSQSAADGAPVGVARGKASTKAIETYNMVQMDAYNKESLSPCPNCGRTFLPDRLQVHLRSCKPGHTAKPLRAPAAAAADTTAAAPPTAAGATGAASGPKAGAKARAAPASSAPPAGAEDQPIRAAGRYVLPADADVDAVPPAASPPAGTTTTTTARAPRSSAAPAPASGENTPIRASGSYTLPGGAGEDSIPPGASSQPKSSPTQRAVPRRVSIIEPDADEAHLIDSDADSEDVQLTEESPALGMAAEQRLSMSAEREALDESSTPYRPAAMEHSLSDSQNEIKVDVMEALDAPSLPAHVATTTAAPESSDQPAAQSRRSAGNTASATRRAGAAPASVESEDGGDGGTPRKKIALNNVSRFKNVQSKLKQQLAQQAETSNLTPCQYCGRTFAPDRVAKHESCCLDRNKAPAPAARKPQSAVKKPAAFANARRASSPAAAGPTPTTSAASATTETPAATSAARFCDQCGTKLGAPGQKFCGGCGNKL